MCIDIDWRNSHRFVFCPLLQVTRQREERKELLKEGQMLGTILVAPSDDEEDFYDGDDLIEDTDYRPDADDEHEDECDASGEESAATPALSKRKRTDAALQSSSTSKRRKLSKEQGEKLEGFRKPVPKFMRGKFFNVTHFDTNAHNN